MVVNLQQMNFVPQGADHPILSSIDLQLQPNEWLCVLGGNGSGKSTLAQLLAGWHPDLLSGYLQGTAQVLNQSLDKNSLVAVSASRQLIQQSPQLQLSGCTFTVEQEVAFGPENLGLSIEEIHTRVDEALAFTFCEPLRTRHPATLSGGEAQRVVLASALAMRPQLLLLDEAFTRLTPSATHRILIQLKHDCQQNGCSVILFERNLLPALDFCEKFLLLNAGKPLASGSAEQIFMLAQNSINMPDAWRAIAHLIEAGYWKAPIPRNESQLLLALKEFYASA
ncbi:MAG: ABC transporter ATP-binding protein [Providencia heimbachae]|nr:ABC transporter ATP-binding protein [Providencia heimbachae]